MKNKKQKQYPMSGPPLRIQTLMQSPLANRTELLAWLKDNPNMRPETREAITGPLSRG